MPATTHGGRAEVLTTTRGGPDLKTFDSSAAEERGAGARRPAPAAGSWAVAPESADPSSDAERLLLPGVFVG